MDESKVGVRELRQNLSVYLRRVKKGEALEVTERGQTVALLVPLPEPNTALERLVAAGRVTPPQRDPLGLKAPEGVVSTRLSEALEENRRERL